MLELGSGFTFVARQKRIRIADEWYRIDLLLFHRVDTVYDPQALTRDFKAGRWANIMVNTILRRE